MKVLIAAILGASVAATAGCASTSNANLYFGQSHTVGISIGATAGDQGGDFVLGYEDKNFAIVPVSLHTSPDTSAQIVSESGNGFSDSLSVLGQFQVNSPTTSGNVGLGKFFATGSAAKALADGFACKIAEDPTCFATGEGASAAGQP